jgi:peptidyl-prolyl cis-trans isomerase A (cyclophilin A)
MMHRTLCALTPALALAVACQSKADDQPAAPAKAAPAPKPAPAAPPPAAAPAPAVSAAAGPMDPSALTETAPETYTVKLETTKGDVLIDVTRAWAPQGADRFYNLVKGGYYTDIAFFRVIGGFMAQFGIHGNPEVSGVWRKATFPDDAVKASNTRGMVTFATSGPNTRTTQLFINFGDNNRLDGMGFSPFGKVRDMSTVDALYAGYGEGAPRGQGPNQGLIQSQGNTYLRASFPEMDYIKQASLVTP